MKKLQTFLTTICILSAISCVAQQKNVIQDTTIASYEGTINKQLFVTDSTVLLNGKYEFRSHQQKSIIDNQFKISEFNVLGNFLNNKKHENWRYQFFTYELADLKINRTRNVNLNHNINGIEDEFLFQFKNGQYNGKAEWLQKKISNGRIGNTQRIATIELNNDTLIGAFYFNLKDVQIKGKTNKHGFLDGELEITYPFNDDIIIETRNYQDGFLLTLEKKSALTDKQLELLNYSDVIDKLLKIKNKEKSLNYKISANYFGTKFKPGYQQIDARIKSQLLANQVLIKHFNMFDSINAILSNEQKQLLTLKLTRRFQYIYDNKDDSLATELTIVANNLSSEINTYLEKPNFILRKNNSELLFHNYEAIKHIANKTETIIQVLNKITNGYFDFRFRDKYYESGIDGVNKPDSFRYQFKNQSFARPFNINFYIDNPQNLLPNIATYLQLLKNQTDSTIQIIRTSITTYENQDIIDSLDRAISLYDEAITKYYINPNKTIIEDQSKVSYSFKMYQSLNERVVNQLKNKYLNNSLSQDEMISTGNNLICYYKFLIENKTQLDEIGRMQKYWNDSLFTIYKDHPFDYRKFETKTLEGVQSASNILLTSYANTLLNVKNCEQLNNELLKITNLSNRVQYLVKKHESANVQQLNKALRRERVPNRIERILEL